MSTLKSRPQVTVITPSLPERREFRQDAIDSVAAQEPSYDGQPYVAEHIVHIDYKRKGVVPTLNKLWPQVTTEWIQVLADDDLLDPDYFRSLFALVGSAYDVYYAYCRVLGRPGWNPNQPFNPELLRAINTIPATAMIRRSLVEKLGGWRMPKEGWEDWDFWLRALNAGARFRCLQRATWTYRFHDSNISTT